MSTIETTPATATDGVLTYQLDPTHSSARFSVRHLMISHVRGDFSKMSGTLTYNAGNPEASHVEVVIEADSINTGQAQRDEHLNSGDFLEAAVYPTITFVSKKISKTGEDTGRITGDLTIHDVTKEVTLDTEGSLLEVKDPWGNWRLGFTGTTKIKRSDFGLTYNSLLEAGGVMIGDEVEITLDAQFVRPA